MKKHSLRIVGGDYRRTRIPVIDAIGLRPTPDRVRETLYNWLRHFWDGNFTNKRVLDLFAGTGALGFEAASRGAAYVQMVETNPAAITALTQLRTRLGANNVHIVPGDARAMLARRPAAPFDLVLLDPPFRREWLSALWPGLPALMTPDGLLYVESESPIDPPAAFERLRQARAGAVHFHLLRFAAPQRTRNNATTESNDARERPEYRALEPPTHPKQE